MRAIPARALRVYVDGETLWDVLPHLREIYCGTVAYEIEHLSSHEQRRWLREAIESRRFWVPTQVEEKRRLLIRLLRVEGLEMYLRRTFLGAKTFSIEGLDMMILMLDEAVLLAAEEGIEEAVFGMAHRGRLNVLAHVLRRPYRDIFAEFEGEHALDVETLRPDHGSGDVKYHHAANTTRTFEVGGETRAIRLSLVPNPSHLEFVNPVVMGRTRALETVYAAPASVTHDRRRALSVLIHGDSAFSGQGIVAESLNLGTLPGYTVGGALHLIANNQIGFTTDPRDFRSTRHSSDLAKGFNVPIIHVNADHLAGCRAAVRLAMAFRARFGRDVLIDLVGYRRWGHNEGDEPAYTHPKMYDLVRTHKPIAEQYAEEIVGDGIATEEEVAEMRLHVTRRLKEEHEPRPRAEVARAGGRAGPLGDADGRQRGASAQAQRRAARDPRGLHGASQAGVPAGAAREGARRRHDRLGNRRVAGVCIAAVRRRARADDRPGHRARHLLEPARRAARRRDGRAVHAARAPRQRARRVRDPQLAADRERVPRLRARLLGHPPGGAGDLGGAVRRLRQRRAGDHRPVHRLVRVEVGREVAAHAAAATRLRGQRPRALLRPPRAVPEDGRRGQHDDRQPDHARAVLPPVAAAGAGQAAPAADRDDAEEPAPREGRRSRASIS